MRIRYAVMIVSVLLALAVAGCATDRDAQNKQQSQNIRRGASLLSATNAVPGSTYDVGVYIIDKGDTVSRIAHQFQISVRDFMAINPGLDPTRLVVGQEVRVYERRRME